MSKPQNVRVEVSGHHRHKVIEGRVLQWCQTVESFDGAFHQVPAVMVQLDGGVVETVPLQTRYTCTRVMVSDGIDA